LRNTVTCDIGVSTYRGITVSPAQHIECSWEVRVVSTGIFFFFQRIFEIGNVSRGNHDRGTFSLWDVRTKRLDNTCKHRVCMWVISSTSYRIFERRVHPRLNIDLRYQLVYATFPEDPASAVPWDVDQEGKENKCRRGFFSFLSSV